MNIIKRFTSSKSIHAHRRRMTEIRRDILEDSYLEQQHDELTGGLSVFSEHFLSVICLTEQLTLILLVVIQLERHVAGGTLEAEFVVDITSGFHPLCGIH